MHGYNKWLDAAAQRDCHRRWLPDSARTGRVRERERGENIKDRREKEGEWQQKRSPDSALTAALQHTHAQQYTSKHAVHSTQRIEVSISSPNIIRDLYDASLSDQALCAAVSDRASLIHVNLPQSRSAGGAKVKTWPVWARAERGPLILFKETPTLHALVIQRQASHRWQRPAEIC